MKKQFVLSPLIYFVIFFMLFNSTTSADKLLSKGKYTFPNALPGKIIEVKRVLKDDGTIELQISGASEITTLEELYNYKELEDISAKQANPKLSGTLRSTYGDLEDTSKIEIQVRLSIEITDGLLSELGLEPEDIVKVNDFELRTTIEKKNIDGLRSNPKVISIIEYKELPAQLSGGDEGCENCDYEQIYMKDFTEAAYNYPDIATEMPSYGKGSGIKVATRENGISEDYFQELDAYPDYPNVNRSNFFIDGDDDDSHGQMALRCALDAAPQATPYHRSSFAQLFSEGIHTMSTSASSIGGDNKFDVESYAYSSLRPLIVEPSNNYGIGKFPAAYFHDLYNILMVGGATVTWNLENDLRYYEVITEDIWHYDDANVDPNWNWVKYAQQTPTCTRNPLLSYYGKFPSDRELPHVVTSTLFKCVGAAKDELQPDAGRPIACTSAGAPSVNGVAGCVMGARPTIMKSKPENVKVALMLTAENVDGGYWDPLEDGIDGCGMVSGYNAVEFARTVNAVSTNNGAIESGISYGQILESSNPQVLSFNIATPSQLPEGKHLRAVLTWSSSINSADETMVISDLNIELRNKYSNQWVGGCYSFEDNFEVIDIPHSLLNTNDEYKLDVLIDHLYIPSNISHKYIYYSVGWTWVEDYAGKKIENANINPSTSAKDLSKFIKYNTSLMNRNIVVGSNVNLNPYNTDIPITAGKKITIQPGTVITPEGQDGKVTFKICKTAHVYAINEHTSGDNILDLFGKMNGVRNSSLLYVLNHFEQDKRIGFDGTLYYELNVEELDGAKLTDDMPLYENGLSLSMWMRVDESVEDGYIYYASDQNGEQGFYLKIEDNSDNGRLKFYIGKDDVTNSVITHNLTDTEINIGTGGPRCIHVAVLWNPGEFLKFYVNGNLAQTETYNIIDEYSIPSTAKYFIGRGYDSNSPYFKGAIEYVKIYAGVIQEYLIESQYHAHHYPEWPSARVNIILESSSGGIIQYHTNYSEQKIIFDPTTNGSQKELTFGENGSLSCSFYAGPGCKVKEVIIDGVNMGAIEKWVCDKVYGTLDENSVIKVVVEPIKIYSSSNSYSHGDKVKVYYGLYDHRYYYCVTPNGPANVHTPYEYSPDIYGHYWLEIWKEGVDYDNGHIVRYPFYDHNGQYDEYKCIQQHYNSSEVNKPPNNSYWNSLEWDENNQYVTGDYAINRAGGRVYKCLITHGPNPDQHAPDQYSASLSDYWILSWNGNSGASFLDRVEFLDSYYVCINREQADQPTNTDYFSKISLWQTANNYQVRHCVEYNGKLYICINSHTSTSNNNPFTDISNPTNNYWARLSVWQGYEIEYVEGKDIVVTMYASGMYKCSNSHTGDYAYIPGITGQDYWDLWNP